MTSLPPASLRLAHLRRLALACRCPAAARRYRPLATGPAFVVANLATTFPAARDLRGNGPQGRN